MEIDLSPFLNAGIASIVLVWFMLRLERILSRLDESLQLMGRAIIHLAARRESEIAADLSSAISRGRTDEG